MTGLTDFVEALEQTLAKDHGAPLLRGIVSQQKDVCGGLLHQASLAKEALTADGTARATFEERRATLRIELERLRAEKTDITTRLHSVRSVMLDRVGQEAGRLNQQILAKVTEWILNCPSEDVCKKDLAAVLSKILSDRLEVLDSELRKAYGQVADQACQRVTKTLAAMEHRARDILAPGERRDVERSRFAAARRMGDLIG